MQGLKIRCAKDVAEVLIYEDIGVGMFEGLSAKVFAKELQSLPKSVREINVRLNSSGGDVFEGYAIYNTLRRHKAEVTVDIDGAALSIASVIAMAASPGGLRMASNAFMMIHDPWTMAIGGAEDMRKRAGLLDEIKDKIVGTYADRTGRDADEIAGWMAEETWLDAEAAHEFGFVDAVTGDLAVAAHFNRHVCQKVPTNIALLQERTERLHKERCERLRKTLDELTR